MKIALRIAARLGALINPSRENRQRQAQVLVKVADLFSFGFEVRLVGMGQNEVENEQPGVDELVRLAAPVAEIILVDGTVNPSESRGCEHTFVCRIRLRERASG